MQENPSDTGAGNDMPFEMKHPTIVSTEADILCVYSAPPGMFSLKFIFTIEIIREILHYHKND